MGQYDVAFSFHQLDEDLAMKLYDIVRDRVDAFIYSKRQEDLISKDGIEEFTEVFTTKSRLVVLLYRTEYGSTSWTKIEETAIKSRRFNEGFDFLITIPTQDNLEVPKWIPDFIIWANLKKLTHEEIGSLIINKIKTLGGKINKNPLEAKSLRIKREQDFIINLESYYRTEECINDYKQLKADLISHFEKKANEIFKTNMGFEISLSKDTNAIALTIPFFAIRFRSLISNSHNLRDTKLTVIIVKSIESDEIPEERDTKIILNEELTFYKDSNWNSVWKSLKDVYFSNEQLIEHYFIKLLDYYQHREDYKNKLFF